MKRLSLWRSMLGCEVRFRDAGGVRTRCLEAGRGEPLILVHGLGGHAEQFAYNLLLLSRTFRVMAVDLIGHGLTDKPRLPYNIGDYTKHLLAVMDAVGLQRANFVGVSLGGWLATSLALEAPHRVHRLVNCNGAGFAWSKRPQREEEDEFRSLVTKYRSLSEPTPENVRARLELLMHDPDDCTDELVDIRLEFELAQRRQEISGDLAAILAPDSPTRGTYGLTEQRLQNLERPALFLWGAQNPGVWTSSAQYAADLAPQGSLHVIDRVAHWPNWEAPERFNAVTADFLTP